jgi:hypothetical protein
MMNDTKHLECSFRIFGPYGKQPHYFILCGEDHTYSPVAANRQEVTCSKCLEQAQHINEIEKHILHKPELQGGYTNFHAILKLKGFTSMIEAINAGYSFVHNGKHHPIINIIKRPAEKKPLKFKFPESGYCRVYFSSEQKLYCWQYDGKQEGFKFYRCTKEGEPSHSADPEYFEHPVESLADDSIEGDLKIYLKRTH